MRTHNPTLFIECLATEIVETYKHLVGISEEEEKQCLQKWQQNSDFSCFLKINSSKLCHRILIFFFFRVTCNAAVFDWVIIVSLTFFLRQLSSIL